MRLLYAVIIALLLVLWPTTIGAQQSATSPASVSTTSEDSVYMQIADLDMLQWLYRSYRGEYIFCLRGEITGKAIYIHKVLWLPLRVSTPTAAVPTGACWESYPAGVIGNLHNHDGNVGTDSNIGCNLSRTDIKAFLHELNPYPLAVVQCGSRKFAFFHKPQVRKEIKDNPWRAVLFAKPGQIVEFSS